IDTPRMPDDFYDSTQANQFVQFTTRLVGVDDNHQDVLLNSQGVRDISFSWRDNAVYGATGGGPFQRIYFSTVEDGTQPPIVSGGVSDLQFDQVSLAGPSGYGPQGFFAPSAALPYQINLENSSTATAPVKKVVITNQLDANLDWTTFQLA